MNARRSLVRGFVWTLLSLGALIAIGRVGAAEVPTKPEGEMRWALYVTIAPAWLDPGEVSGFITPFWIQYALHDALVKPMPGNIMTPSLAESWTLGPDQRVYEFTLRRGLRFHNGDPFTAEDVKFSFYRAKSSRILKDPAAPLRARAVRPDLGVHLAERDRPPRGRAGAAQDRPVSVVGAPGGRDAQVKVADGIAPLAGADGGEGRAWATYASRSMKL